MTRQKACSMFAGRRKRFRVETLLWLTRPRPESPSGTLFGPEEIEPAEMSRVPHKRFKYIAKQTSAQRTKGHEEAAALAQWEDDGGA
jgi:hypothetical protein